MQTFSLPALALLAQVPAPTAAPDARTMWLDLLARLGDDWRSLALYVVLAEVVVLLCYWLASKPVAEVEEGHLGNALKIWGYHNLFTLVYGSIVGGFIPNFLRLSAGGRTNPGFGYLLVLVLLAGVSLAYLIAIFIAPMRVYRIDFPSSIVFLLIAFALMFAGGYGLDHALGRPLVRIAQRVEGWPVRLGAAPLPVRLKEPKARTDTSLEKRAADKSKSLAERQQALKEWYAQLEAMRMKLDSSNPAGVSEYESRKARYEEVLAELKAEVAAQRGAAQP